ncbi:hypothetical protein [Acidaminococcus intestini]
MSLGDHAYTVLKDRRKKRRVLIQFIILLLVLLGIFYAFFFLKSYTPYAEDEESSTLNTGFIALSYGGVDRTGRTSDLIGEPLLNDHLAAFGKPAMSQSPVKTWPPIIMKENAFRRGLCI